jgi:hypothetical protein
VVPLGMAWSSTAQDLARKAPTRKTWAIVAFALGILFLSGLPTSGAAPSAPPSAQGSALDASSTAGGSALLASALASLEQSNNPVSPGAQCQLLSSSSASCTIATPARPHPSSFGANGDWVNVTNNLTGGQSSEPSARYIEAVAYDAADGYVLLFGGINPTTNSLLADTWTYQNGAWNLLNVPGPSGRYAAQMAYDPPDHEVVLFSGYDYSTATTINDTWTFANGTWTQLSFTGTTPEARWRGNFAYDAYDGYLLLTGGTGTGNGLFDTWSFVNNTWTDLTSKAGTGPGLYRSVMTYDAADQEIVLFGGSTSTGSTVSQTWTYKSLKWTQLTLTVYPSARVYAYMAYDPTRSAVILFGGSSASGSGTILSDTWSFSGGSWTKLSPATSPMARGYGTMVYDPVDGDLVLYGGYTNSVAYVDTWSFNAPIVVWGNATPALLDSGLPTTFHLQVVSKLTNLSYWYSGLPSGCTSQNSTTLPCTSSQYGTFDVLGGANDSTGDNASVNITLDLRQDPTVTAILFEPPAIDLGITAKIVANVSGGAPPLSYKWPKLPPGCLAANASMLTCTPTSAGSFPVEVSVTDRSGIVGYGNGTLVVNGTPSISEFVASPSEIDVGQPTTFYANVTRGSGPYTFNWTKLPLGCTPANVSNITCTPVSIGGASYTVEVQATDRFNLSVTGNISLTVNTDPAFVSAGLSPVPVDVGIPFHLYMNVSDGTAPFTYRYANLPPGCTPRGGAVATCSSNASGTFNITITATDAQGLSVASTVQTLTVTSDPVVSSLVADPSVTDVDAASVITTNASLGTGIYGYQYTGLPSGCLSSNNATIVCVPILQGDFTVNVTVTDTQGATGTASVSLTVNAAPAVTSFQAAPSPVTVNTAVTFTVTVANGTSPFHYQFVGFPAGCSSADKASLACTPSQTGSFSIQVIVRDSAGAQTTANLSLSVQSASGPTFLGLPLVEGLAILIPLILVVAIVAFLVVRRRRRPPAAAPVAEYDSGPLVEPPP